MIYSAAVIDCEGTIDIAGNPPCTLRLQAYNNVRDCLQIIVETFDKGKIYEWPRGENSDARYHYVAHGDDAYQVIAVIEPYLKVCREQAVLAIVYRNKFMVARHNGKVSCEDRMQRQRFKRSISLLNRRTRKWEK